MADIIERIKTLCPSAVVEGDTIPVVTVDDDHWHALAKALHDDPELAYTYLVTVVGMDWIENLGAIYYVMNTDADRILGVKILAKGTREQPVIT